MMTYSKVCTCNLQPLPIGHVLHQGPPLSVVPEIHYNKYVNQVALLLLLVLIDSSNKGKKHRSNNGNEPRDQSFCIVGFLNWKEKRMISLSPICKS